MSTGHTPLPARDLLGDGARVCRRAWRRLLVLAAIVPVPVALVAFMVARETIPLGAWIEHGTILTASDTSPDPAGLVTRIAVVMTVLGNLLSMAVLHIAVVDASAGGSGDWRASLRAGVRRGPAVLAVAAATTAVSAIPGSLVAIFGVSDTSVLSTVTDLALLAVVLISMTVGMFAIPAAVREGLGPLTAMRRAWSLLASGWARVTTAFLLCGAIGGVVVAVLNVSVGQAVRSSTNSVDTVIVGILIPFVLGLALLAPLNAAVATLAYVGQRRLHGEDPGQDPVTAESIEPAGTSSTPPAAAGETASVLSDDPAPRPVTGDTPVAVPVIGEPHDPATPEDVADVPTIIAGSTLVPDARASAEEVAPPPGIPMDADRYEVMPANMDQDGIAPPPLVAPGAATTTEVTPGAAPSSPPSASPDTAHETSGMAPVPPPALPEWSDDEDTAMAPVPPGDVPTEEMSEAGSVGPDVTMPVPVPVQTAPTGAASGPPVPVAPTGADAVHVPPPVPVVPRQATPATERPPAPRPVATPMQPAVPVASRPTPPRQPAQQRTPGVSMVTSDAAARPATTAPTPLGAGNPGPERPRLRPMSPTPGAPSPADPSTSAQQEPAAGDDDIPRIAVIPVSRRSGGTPAAPGRPVTSRPPDVARTPAHPAPPAPSGLPDWDDEGDADTMDTAPRPPVRPAHATAPAVRPPGPSTGRPPAPSSPRPQRPAPPSRPSGRPPDGAGAPAPRPAQRPPVPTRSPERPAPRPDPNPTRR